MFIIIIIIVIIIISSSSSSGSSGGGGGSSSSSSIVLLLLLSLLLILLLLLLSLLLLPSLAGHERRESAIIGLGGTRCTELGGGWSTQSFSETFGFLSSPLNICHKGERQDLLWLRSPKVAEIYVCLLGGRGPLCVSLAALP